MVDATLHSEPEFRRTVEQTLRSATLALGLRSAFLSWFDGETFRVTAATDAGGTGLAAGDAFPLEDSLCSRFVAGAPAATTDAQLDEHYRHAPAAERFRIRAYAASEVRSEDELVGTLCVLDTEDRQVDEQALDILDSLAELVGQLYTEHRTRERLRRMYLRLTAESERRDRLVEELAVELSAPLEAIEALADLADSASGRSVREDALRMAGLHASRASVLLGSLGVSERSDADDEPLQVIDVAGAVREVVEEIADAIAPGVEVRRRGRALLRTRPVTLRRLVALLVLGAAERTDEGAIVVSVHPGDREVILEVATAGATAREVPDDRGRPMSWSMIRRLSSRLGGVVNRPDGDDPGRIAVALPHVDGPPGVEPDDAAPARDPVAPGRNDQP